MSICTSAIDRRWPNGDVPYEVPACWAANDRLLAVLTETIEQFNAVLRGHVQIRNRKPGDRNYLVLHATTRTERAEGLGRQGGPQKLHCQVHSLIEDATPVGGSLMTGLCRALGLPLDVANTKHGALSDCSVAMIKGIYPRL